MNFIIHVPEEYLSIDKSLYEMIADMAKDGVNGHSKLFSDHATNGDVIKTMFPKAKIFNEDTSCATMKIDMGEHDEYVDFYTDWWNAPYKENTNDL